ncbi:MAG TPA: hypothetical protein VJV79_14265 [Polyangiaceae bacterium]|nr:hypothetical protein [Polyangiaceae bacterium]
MAGHKHLATTARYVHLLRGDLDEAAYASATCSQRRRPPLPLHHLLTQRKIL